MQKYNVGVLGCSGLVGQVFCQLLSNNELFVIKVLGGNSSAGKKYGAIDWCLSEAFPEVLRDVDIVECTPDNFKDCRIVFSAIDAPSDEEGARIEQLFADVGIAVFSNTKYHRMQPDKPILVPTANPGHLRSVTHQKTFKKGGFIVSNANCSSTGVIVPLQAFIRSGFEIETVSVVTMQAISGAGIKGPSSLAMIDNVIPFIAKEEQKMETEPKKVLGHFNTEAGQFDMRPLRISAQCNRVNVLHGHTTCVSIKFSGNKPSIEELERALQNYTVEELQGCPSAPKQPIIYLDKLDRPQPRLDRHNSFSVVVGKIRECPVNHIKFTCLVHNLHLGAAGSGILGAELAAKQGLIE